LQTAATTQTRPAWGTGRRQRRLSRPVPGSWSWAPGPRSSPR